LWLPSGARLWVADAIFESFEINRARALLAP
jgi:hypothetical protein